MKIKVLSDLHLEFSEYEPENNENADVLILSGDIMIAEELYDVPPPSMYGAPGSVKDYQTKINRVAGYRRFLKACSERFANTIYVAGNHEFYGGKWDRTPIVLSEECAKLGNVWFLERGCKRIDDVTFVGGTLWTDLNKGDPLTLHAVRDMMMDYKEIRKEYEGYTRLKPHDTVMRHRETLGYIKSVLAEKGDEKFVVCSHHSPSFQSVAEEYRAQYLMNGAYHSSLEEFILDHPQIKLWTHGHTHHPFDYTIGETRIVCNPRGYQTNGWSEDTGWNPNLIIEV
jgi:predicted phosphodiesterase